MAPSISVVIPTSGRRSLRRTLRRLRREDAGDLEVIVVSDGPQPVAEKIAGRLSRRWPDLRYHEGPATHNWGNAQRMAGIERARGSHLMFIDDDDVTVRGAFAAIRREVARNPDRILLFRVKRHGELLWRTPAVAFGNVSTQQVVIPNRPGSVGSWLSRDVYESDLDFIRECVALQGEPVWAADVIAIVDPFRWRAANKWLAPRALRWRKRVRIRTRLRRLSSCRGGAGR